MDLFYHGFCNSTIWPLFHYFTSYCVYDEAHWQSYEEINRAFCETLEGIIKPGDVVWIQDYHLMLLPHLLREKFDSISISFFLHIPFGAVGILLAVTLLGTYELYKEIITGLFKGKFALDYIAVLAVTVSIISLRKPDKYRVVLRHC